MKKPCIEYISTCACCENNIDMIEALAEKYAGKVETVIYRAGRDFGYIEKYGPVSHNMLVINETKAVKEINKTTVTQAFEEAISTC